MVWSADQAANAPGIAAHAQPTEYPTAPATIRQRQVATALRRAPALNAAEVLPISADFAATASCHPIGRAFASRADHSALIPISFITLSMISVSRLKTLLVASKSSGPTIR